MDIILRYSGHRVSKALLVVSKHISIVIPAALTSEWLRIERLETEQADVFQIDLYPTLDISHLNLCDNIDSFNLHEEDEDPGGGERAIEDGEDAGEGEADGDA